MGGESALGNGADGCPAQDRAFVSVETGELVIVRFTPACYEEVDCTHLLTPTTRTRGRGFNRWRNVDRAVLWAHPAFVNGHVVADSPLAG